jgi:NADH dehydrogenase
MTSRVPHVAIIGGGFGGLDAARALAGAPVSVTLLDRHNHHVFQPLLYQVATAGLSPGDIASPIRWILRRQRNVRVLLAEVRAIDPAAKRLLLDDGSSMAFDYLIVATGALEIRRRLLLAFERAERETDPARQRHLLTFVIVGGGPTGVELAGMIVEIARHALKREFKAIDPESARVVLIEAGPSILASFPDSLRDAARRSLRRLGVEVWEHAAVTAVEEGAVRVSGDLVPAHTILWAAGVAASPLARSLGVPLDRTGRVLVEADLSIPGQPDVFAVGDLVHLIQPDEKLLPGVAQAAKQTGAHAARNLLRRFAGEPTLPFRYRDPGNMATIGRATAVADFGWLRLSGFLAWLFWLFVHILFLIGFRNRLSVMIQWAASYLTYQRSVRLITGTNRDSG